MDSNKSTILSLIDKWSLNKIPSSQLLLIKTIASGGQGKVKLGKYHDMYVIVKILHKLTQQTFTQELFNAYKYRHPTIPKFLGVYESKEHFGMVFEYIDGVTMTKLISLEKSKKIETNLIQKIDYLIQLASVIDFLHSHSLMHRDLKTDNIMIDHLGQVKLLDFGIAITGKEKWINMESPEYSLTPNYMAPEIAVQAQDEDDDDEINEDEEEEDDYNNDTQCKPSSSQQNNTLSSDYSDNSKKICETYHQQQSTLSSFNNIELPQYAQTEECKDGTSYCGKWILITNKYDIWTFGIIMAQLFTRCKPWCRSEKENISEMEAQNRLIANVPYPIHKLHPQEECKPYSKEIIHIIRQCLITNPQQRIDIRNVKSLLQNIFKLEIANKVRIEKMMNLQRKNKENTLIKDLLNKIKNEEQKRNIIRFNKLLIRNESDLTKNLNAINEINDHINKGDNTNTEAKQLLINRFHEISSITNNTDFEIGRSMITILQQSNLQKAQELRIKEHLLFQLQYQLKYGNGLNK